MKFVRNFGITVFMLLGALVIPGAQGQSTFSDTTHVKFSGPVEISGRVLPAGSYIFRLNALPSNLGNLVQIQNNDGTKTIMNVLTIPDYRLRPTSKTVITFDEHSGNGPEALRAWFYPGENYGHEFVYPTKRAVQLAAANNVNVPEIPEGTSEKNLQGAHVTQATPSGSHTEVAQAIAPAPAAPAENNDNSNNSNSNTEVASNQPLPKTASDTYTVALLGVFFISAGLLIGVLRRTMAHDQGR